MHSVIRIKSTGEHVKMRRNNAHWGSWNTVVYGKIFLSDVLSLSGIANRVCNVRITLKDRGHAYFAIFYQLPFSYIFHHTV